MHYNVQRNMNNKRDLSISASFCVKSECDGTRASAFPQTGRGPGALLSALQLGTRKIRMQPALAPQ